MQAMRIVDPPLPCRAEVTPKTAAPPPGGDGAIYPSSMGKSGSVDAAADGAYSRRRGRDRLHALARLGDWDVARAHRQDHDLGAERDAAVEIHNVLVQHADAAGGHAAADR